MKVINVMNFVRQCEPRNEERDKKLFPTTKAQLELLKKYDIDNTFLLQYDALCDKRYTDLFLNEATDKTETGLWLEIVEPLTSACGLPYRSENGWKWDWHIVPGFSMGYTPNDRELLIDEAMRKFKEVFGRYPKTVASWLIDTHSVNYLTDNYKIDCICICRDQMNTDAYTLRGGYFNQAYFPSRSNMFTPAQTDEYRVNTPVFRLLGPCPVHNYDATKYLSDEMKEIPGCYTMELVWKAGSDPNTVDWFYKTFFENESLNFAYTQIGQENSFANRDLITPLKMQIDKGLDLDGVEFKKMSETGRLFKEKFKGKTPATAVAATEDWDNNDIQSVYFDCQNYTVNFFRYNKQLFIRAMYLFDERVEDRYMRESCDTFDAVYENLPIVDTLDNVEKENIGLLIDTDVDSFAVRKVTDASLSLQYREKRIVVGEEGIVLEGRFDLKLFKGRYAVICDVRSEEICYEHRGTRYSLCVENATVKERSDCVLITGENIVLRAKRG